MTATVHRTAHIRRRRLAVVNIEEFYEQNEARRTSAEIEFGDQWADADGRVYELSWVEATGELYLMADANAQVIEDFMGDGRVMAEPLEALSVKVIGTVTGRDEVERQLAGWSDVAGTAGSLSWLATRFPGVAAP